jgi:uncharacterized protein (TIGR01319 family)
VSPDDIQTIAVTDCGSTTTKAILIEKVDGVFRHTARGDAPTTVEAPNLDITRGVRDSLEAVAAMRRRPLLDRSGQLIRPGSPEAGVDLYLSTSSAGGGLQMVVAGVVRKMSAASAERAALGAGAIVTGVVACDDDLPLTEQIDRLRHLKPDMVLLAGGTDGGADVLVVELAELLAAADPRPRFGDGFLLPVIFAGNREAREAVGAALGERCELFVEENLMRTVDEENLGPARERVHELFLDHVMRRAPGFQNLTTWTDAPVMPTPSAVGEMLAREAERRGAAILCVDIGGATTDIFSVVSGRFVRTVSANLGMSYSATNVLKEAGAGAVSRWLPFDIEEDELVDLVMNKTIRPTTIPDSDRELVIEQALAVEALGLSFEQHRRFAAGGSGDPAGMISLRENRETASVSPMALDLIIGSGGVISHAPDPVQAAVMLIDGFQPEGVTRLAKDAIFMMPHLGVLSRILPEAAAEVFERDCLEDLGTCAAPVFGRRRKGQCLRYSLAPRSGPVQSGTLEIGDIKRLPLETGEVAELSLWPKRGVDAGAGKGKPWCGAVTGGPLGVLLDGRGRPIQWPEEKASRLAVVSGWRRVLTEAARPFEELR